MSVPEPPLAAAYRDAVELVATAPAGGGVVQARLWELLRARGHELGAAARHGLREALAQHAQIRSVRLKVEGAPSGAEGAPLRYVATEQLVRATLGIAPDVDVSEDQYLILCLLGRRCVVARRYAHAAARGVLGACSSRLHCPAA